MRCTAHVRAAFASVLLLSAASGAAGQQVTENCTVSVLNRTVTAGPDGTWVLPNVPANFGPVRARVTCLVNGQTISGESDPFTVPANGVVNLPPIRFGQTTPIPTGLTLTAPTTTLTTIGQTTQLTVTARYSDNTTKDVTAGSAFTQYTVSNPAIATVSGGGLVQAITSGTVLIQATHEGASGMIAIRVALVGADSDGDGIPDDYELAHGMNPNNPVDAQEDPDRDGLTNLQEYLLGTDPRNADTDGDGLKDGDEVARGTNPLLKDTDGDGISDGLEVQTGSDPLNPASYNLAGALSGMTVTPPIFTLTFNTIAGDVSVQLRVIGALRDNTTIDVTSKAGVNYASSNINSCNFSAAKGRVFAGQAGSCVITVTAGGFSTTSSGTVHTFSPIPLSSLPLGGSGNGVDVRGNFTYVAVGGVGLSVVDVSNRNAPRIVGTLALLGTVNDVKVAGTLAYVAAGAAGLHIVDVSNPLLPRLLGSVDTPGDARRVRVRGNLAFVADGPSGLQIIDTTTASASRIIGSVATAGTANGVDVTDTLAVVAVDSAGVQVVNVTNPTNPVSVGGVDTPGQALDVVVKGSFAYVADYTGSLRVVDFSTPSAPVLGATTPGSLGGYLLSVAMMDSFVFGADILFVNGVPIVDVSTPSNPIPRAILNFPGDSTGQGIAVDGSYVYLVGSDGKLYIGQYRIQEDLNGVPPTVSIASPGAGATFVEGETIPVTILASDDLAVASVTLLVNGTAVGTGTASPYQFNVTAPVGVSGLTLGATANDLGNNTGVATNVPVNVIPDPLTTVIGRVLAGVGTSAAGLIGYWPLNGNGSDASGGGRNLDLRGGVGFASGAAGQALDLHNNGAQFATRPLDDAVYDFGASDFTIQIWVNFNETTREQNVFEKFTGTNGPGWTLTKLSNNTWHFYSSPSAVLTSPAQVVQSGIWHHVLVRRRGATFEMFYDGLLIQSGSNSSPVSDTSFPLLLGKRNDADGRNFAVDGKIDEVAIWERSLTDVEVAALAGQPALLTTLLGQTGGPVAGVEVNCLGRTAVTAADGSFTVSGVPTAPPTILCSVRGVNDSTTVSGLSARVTPVRGGLTTVGDVLVAPVPVVSSITPKVIDAGHPPAVLQVTGENLSGGTYSFIPLLAPPLLTVGTPQTNAAGTAATLPVTVAASARGRFTLVGTNGFGGADTTPTAGNTITIINAQDDVDSDDDGFPDGLELLFGSDPSNAASVPDLRARGDLLSATVSVRNTGLPSTSPQDVMSGVVSVLNTSLPATTTPQTLLSSAFSVSNTSLPTGSPQALLSSAFSVNNTLPSTGPQTVTSAAVSVLNSSSVAPTPAQTLLASQGLAGSQPSTNATSMTVSVTQPQAGARLIEGQTITIGAAVTGAQSAAAVGFVVNGHPFATISTSPYALIFTVPSGLTNLTFGATATDASGNTVAGGSVSVVVEPDPLTTVTGRVVDAAGNPVQGAVVDLLSEGLQAEFFDFTQPLVSVPDLAGQTPDRVTRITALNVRNPNGVFGFDPFGTHLAPDYAARFTGWIAITAAGTHTFFVGTHAGARLKVGGVTVVDLSAGNGQYQEGSGAIDLAPGLVPIEMTYYEEVGNAELQLSFAPPGGERQIVPPASLVPGAQPFVTTTDASGAFTLRGVPAALAGVQIRATVTANNQNISATSNRVAPVPNTGVYVGNIVVVMPQR